MPADRSNRRGKRGKQGGGGPAGKRSGSVQRRRRTPERTEPEQKTAPQTSAAPHNTSWNPVATWYTGWVGKSGSMYHRKSALPAVLRLAAPERGESLVDIGCGHGILARPVLKTGSAYLGVDFSPRLIEAARAANPKSARFLHGDARELTGLPGVGVGSFDAAVFMLSIQDMDPLDAVIGQAVELLGDGGRLVIYMLHPAFRVPRGSGWGFDPDRKLRYRRVDHYSRELAVPMKAFAEAGAPERRGTTWSFHRPLAAYFRALTDRGLTVDAFEEHADPLEKEPSGIPMFVALRARKPA